MRFVHRMVFLALIFCSLGVQAFAERHWQVVVPFQFEAKGKSFPAGSYDVTLAVDRGLVTLVNTQNATERLQWLGIPSDGNSHDASLKFGEDGSAFELLEVTAGKWSIPHRADADKYVMTASIYDNRHTGLMASGK
jgi:hypothetical protein